jgi:hypothetical protein
MSTVTEREGEARVFTFKEGLLSAVAHDLEIAIERFRIEWDEARTSVTASFDLTSLRVLHPVVHGAPSPGSLSRRDLDKIEDNIAKDVLHTARNQDARFTSSSVSASGNGFSVRGTLALCGRSEEITAQVREEGGRYVTELALDQRRWGITPYSAMMGTLKIKPEVKVRLAVPVS